MIERLLSFSSDTPTNPKPTEHRGICRNRLRNGEIAELRRSSACPRPSCARVFDRVSTCAAADKPRNLCVSRSEYCTAVTHRWIGRAQTQSSLSITEINSCINFVIYKDVIPKRQINMLSVGMIKRCERCLQTPNAWHLCSSSAQPVPSFM